MAKRDSKGRFVRRRRGSRAAAAAPAAAAPRRRRRHTRRTRAAAAPVAAAPRRRRRRRHARAAVAAAPRRRRRHTRSSAAAPRRRRRRSYEAAAPRYHRRRRHARRNPFTGGEFALSVIAGGLGFVVADFVDRYVATYDPSSTSTPPTDRFTGGTNGTLANALNVASPPSLMRIGVGIGMVALPGIGAYVIKNPMGRAALQGMTLGAAIKVFSVLWNTYVMGNLLKPAGTDATSMKASLGARVYPSETVAKQNLATSPVPYTAPTGLNAPPGQRQLPPPQQRPAPHGVAGDPGPFAQTQAPPQPQQLAAPAPQMQQPAARPAAVGLSGLSPYALGLEL